jgi:hypothetical protein
MHERDQKRGCYWLPAFKQATPICALVVHQPDLTQPEPATAQADIDDLSSQKDVVTAADGKGLAPTDTTIRVSSTAANGLESF